MNRNISTTHGGLASAAVAAAVPGHWQPGGTYTAGAVYNSDANMEAMEVKVHPEEDQMMDMCDDTSQSDGEPKKKRIWHKKIGPNGKIMKKKANPVRKNMLLRKTLQPKTAFMCLHELQHGIKYEFELVGGKYCASVEVNGTTYRGYGSNKNAAKHAAAEAALISFVKPPPPKVTGSRPPAGIVDETPWKTIASFAMYKLFSGWREGKVGLEDQKFEVVPPQQNIMANQSSQGDHTPVISEEIVNNIGMHLFPIRDPNNKHNVKAIETKKLPNKTVNESHTTRHPVMALHQLVPNIGYSTQEEFVPPKGKKYLVKSCIHDMEFMGEGTSMKKAKFNLAKSALKGLFDIDNVFEPKEKEVPVPAAAAPIDTVMSA